jgi:protein O-GlcNAc transferase
MRTTFDEALSAHQTGDLSLAEQRYRQLLAGNPRHFDALHLLGVISLQRGRYEDALNLIGQALRINARSAEVFLNYGIVLIELGRHEHALKSFEAALSIKPDYADAYYSSGNALRGLKRYETSLAYYERALALRPDYLAALNNKANVLLDLQRHRVALAIYDQVLALVPHLAEALYNRGTVLLELQQHQDALVSFDKALAVAPAHAGAFNNRSVALLRIGNPEGALGSVDKALAVRPGYVEALNNRGKALLDLKQHEEALSNFLKALVSQPTYLEALNNIGSALHRLKRCSEALVNFDRALLIEPQKTEALCNRANALLGLRRFEHALSGFDSAQATRPDDPETLDGRGSALLCLNRSEAALAAHERALTVKPDSADIHHRRGLALLTLQRVREALSSFDKALGLDPTHVDALNSRSGALSTSGRPDQSVAGLEWILVISPENKDAGSFLLHVKMQCCDWKSFTEDKERLLTGIQTETHQVVPFTLLGLSDSGPKQLLAAQLWTRNTCPPSIAPLTYGEYYHHEKIRIAYLSADFRNHPMAFLMAGVFEQHDRDRFQSIAMSIGPSPLSEMRLRLIKAFDQFIDITSQSDQEAAVLLRKLEVDIVVDLMGFTTNCRTDILARRPAPIQVNYLGYPGTMGAKYIDYIIADRFVIPDEHSENYTEKVIYLPNSFQANDSKRSIVGQVMSKSAARLPEKGFIFCCFNNTYKITPDVFDVWMRLLQKVEDSVLWLVVGNAAVVRNLRREAEQRGVRAERLIFTHRVDYASYLARYTAADLFLDTLPYNAGTTASDALWAGLPVITCAGNAFASRMGASLLNAVGLPQLVTWNLEQYESLALTLARDRTMLASIRAQLERNRMTCPLFDTDGFRRDLESAYTTIWEQHQRGEPPASFSVQRSPP